jgi:hypothetical protein
MAIVFLEGGLSPIPIQMASTKRHRGPRRQGCQSHIVERKDSQIIKRNSLLNLDLLRAYRDRYQKLLKATSSVLDCADTTGRPILSEHFEDYTVW